MVAPRLPLVSRAEIKTPPAGGSVYWIAENHEMDAIERNAREPQAANAAPLFLTPKCAPPCRASAMYASLCHLPRSARPFVRFVIGAGFDRPDRLAGLFRSHYFPEDADERVPAALREEIQSAIDWFNDHLTVPPFHARQFPQTAVCWYRSDAGEFLRRMWELAHLLRAAEVPVRVLRTHRPGRVIYSDEQQIVADSVWRRRPRRRRRWRRAPHR